MKHEFSFLGQFSYNDKGRDYWEVTDQKELHHFYKVLRLSSDEKICVFDGCGTKISGNVISLSNKKKILVEAEVKNYCAPSQNSLIICLGALKPSTMEELLPFLCELGCDEIHVFTQNSTAKFRTSEKALDRFKKIILSSCKQCKRFYIPRLLFWSSLDDMLPIVVNNTRNRYVLSPTANQKVYDTILHAGRTCLILGGEKGLSVDEEELLIKTKFKAISLGENIFRSITAALTSTVVFTFLREKIDRKK